MIYREIVRPEFIDDTLAFDDWLESNGYDPLWMHVATDIDGWMLIEVNKQAIPR
jgi:hypothetical protein